MEKSRRYAQVGFSAIPDADIERLRKGEIVDLDIPVSNLRERITG